MKIYTILGGLALLGGIAYGCNNKKETQDAFSDARVYATDIVREIPESPSNLEAITDAAHDLRYMNGARAANNLSRVDWSRNSEPLQDGRMKASLKKDWHELTKDFDQGLEYLDLQVEKAWHYLEGLIE